MPGHEVVQVSRRMEGGKLTGEVRRDAAGKVVAYKFRFHHPEWSTLDQLRFDHAPEKHEPRHLHMKWLTRTFDEEEVVTALPGLLRDWRRLKEAVT